MYHNNLTTLQYHEQLFDHLHSNWAMTNCDVVNEQRPLKCLQLSLKLTIISLKWPLRFRFSSVNVQYFCLINKNDWYSLSNSILFYYYNNTINFIIKVLSVPCTCNTSDQIVHFTVLALYWCWFVASIIILSNLLIGRWRFSWGLCDIPSYLSTG